MGRLMDNVEWFAPTFHFEIEHDYDFPCRLNLGQFFIDPHPELYCRLVRGGPWVFAHYYFYHYRDNHHRHDLTGVMSAYCDGQHHCTIYRDHFRLRLLRSAQGLPVFTVKAGSHSVCHGSPPSNKYGVFVPKWTYADWIWQYGDKLYSAIGPWAMPPWLWTDEKLKTRLARRWLLQNHGLTTARGLLWDDPLLLINLLERFGG